MGRQAKQTLVCKDLLKLIEVVGKIADLIQRKDLIKFGENDSFKDRLRLYLENTIEYISNATSFYNIKYVEIDDIDRPMDMSIVINRLFYFTTNLVTILVNKEKDEKVINRSISSLIYYIKMMCSIYSIDSNKIVKSINDYQLNTEE